MATLRTTHPSFVRCIIPNEQKKPGSCRIAAVFHYLVRTLPRSVKSTIKEAVFIYLINTTIKTTSVCDGDTRNVGGGRGWLDGDTDGLAGWSMTVDVVSHPAANAERYRCACLHCTQDLAGRGNGYQCGFDLGRYSFF